MQIVARQRCAGALGFWAHPISWWNGADGRFITNIATEMPAHAIADGYLDGMVVMGYHAERPEYQDVWLALLDMGFRVPGVAEVDMGLSEESIDARRPYLNFAPLDPHDPRETIRRAFVEGRTFASSGPMVDLRVDRASPGDVALTARGHTHLVTITARPAKPTERLECVELIGRGGRVIWSGP